MFGNMKLTTKIGVILSSIIMGMIIVAIVSYNGIHKIAQEVKEIAEYEIPLLDAVVEVERDILKEEILLKELVIVSADIFSKRYKDFEKSVDKLEGKTSKAINKCMNLSLRAIDHATSEHIKNQYIIIKNACQNLSKEQREFEVHFSEAIKQVSQGKGTVSFEKKLYDELNQMDQQSIAVIKELEKLTVYLEEQAEQSENFVVLVVEIVSIGFILFAVFIAFLLNKNINKNINRFQTGLIEFFKYLNREQADVKMLHDENKDEFGRMSKVVNENIKKTKSTIEEDRKLIDQTISVLGRFEQGDLSQRLDIKVSNPALMELKNVLNNMADNLEANIENVLSIVEEYSNYNYLNKISTEGLKEHLLKLSNGINSLGDSITKMLVDNKTNGISLNQSSSILIGNVDKLNKNSNEAAAALEETAAALEQITSNVASNTENVVKMADFTQKLSSSANEGQELASQTTSSMEQINEQVTAITDSIALIDQIAFQTNILSLNAAVEAATAGEAGKGFAVVAAEVRNLASRSAEVAKEIKDLVENAKDKADVGKGIADKMIEGYNELNENISETVSLIRDVEIASKEQQNGIVQINDAINSLDQQTQTNAMIASQTNEVALKTDKISKIVVHEADSKEFIGKENIKIKEEVKT